MPRPLPDGCLFTIERRILAANYEMPSFEVATDHYTIGYMISGDRLTITPTTTYSTHPGNIAGCPPFTYHKTTPASDAIYDSILIKFAPDFVKPFTDTFGQQALDDIYTHPVHRFTDIVKEKIFLLLSDMLNTYEKDFIYREFLLQSKLFELLILIIEESLPEEAAIIHKTPLSQPIMEAVYYMENHYADNLSLDKVAQAAGFSPAYFSRLFQSQLGKSYSDYLTNIRLRHVEALLINTNKSVTEIALETGYSHISNLTEQFKKKIGMTPSAFRKAHLSATKH